MKYFFKRDTLLATFSVFLVIGLLSLVPLNTHLLDPLKLALSDISFNDLSFSTLKLHRDNAVDDKIVIVNIGYAGRAEIAAVINKINAAKPKAIGLDVLFNESKDQASDSALAKAISQSPSIVLSNRLSFEENNPVAGNYFSSPHSHGGYINLVGEKAGVIRYFSPFEKMNDTVYQSFTASVVQVSEEIKYNVLHKRKHDLEFINYQRQADQYFLIDYMNLLNGKATPSVFENKIVLIGFVDNNPTNIEDKHFTPLNEKFVGKSIPDMNGVIIHANIISMILERNYIRQSPGWLNWALAVLLSWFFMAFIIRYYLEHHIWFHISAKTIQLLITVIFIYTGILFSKYLNVYISLSPAFVAILLAVDVLYFYEGFSHWAHKKFSFRTVFSKQHHS